MDGLTKFKTILEYSAVPGTSRHHWGTEIDINAATPQYFNTEEGEEVYDWMQKMLLLMVFANLIPQKDQIDQLATMKKNGIGLILPFQKISPKNMQNLISPSDISGFDGDQYVPQLNLINDYVLGINPECLK